MPANWRPPVPTLIFCPSFSYFRTTANTRYLNLLSCRYISPLYLRTGLTLSDASSSVDTSMTYSSGVSGGALGVGFLLGDAFLSREVTTTSLPRLSPVLDVNFVKDIGLVVVVRIDVDFFGVFRPPVLPLPPFSGTQKKSKRRFSSSNAC